MRRPRTETSFQADYYLKPVASLIRAEPVSIQLSALRFVQTRSSASLGVGANEAEQVIERSSSSSRRVSSFDEPRRKQQCRSGVNCASFSRRKINGMGTELGRSQLNCNHHNKNQVMMGRANAVCRCVRLVVEQFAAAKSD